MCKDRVTILGYVSVRALLFLSVAEEFNRNSFTWGLRLQIKNLSSCSSGKTDFCSSILFSQLVQVFLCFEGSFKQAALWEDCELCSK